jgi:type IV pilus assembly protein PilQ
MNSLQSIRDYSLKAVIAMILISMLSLAAAAQRVEQQGRMYGEPGFRGEPINLKVVNADIRDILNYVTEQYGVNFVIDSSVKDVPVTVNVNEVPWNVALDSVLRSQGLGIQVNGNILRVADSKVLAAEGAILRSQRDTQLDTQALVTEFIRLNYAQAKGGYVRGAETAGTITDAAFNPLAPAMALASASGSSSSSSAGQSSGSSSDSLLPIIQRRLSRRGSIEVDGRSNSLIITDVRENVDAIKQLVAILDQPEPQVEIEARIVVATRNFSRDIGMQLASLVTGNNGRMFQGGTLPVTTSSGDTGSGSGGTGQKSGVFTQPNNNLFSALPNTVIGLTTGIFGTAQLGALLSAGEQKGQAKIIATPRVTTLNLQNAKIKSTTKIPIQTIQAGAGGGAPVVNTTYVDVPLSLDIRPQITDVGTVVLDVTAENASTSTITGGAAPAINSQSMSTKVTVPDGGTTVVGGVLFDDERENQDRTPGLWKIPVFGNLFKRKGVQRNTNEILFFITPRISRQDFEIAAGGRSGVKTTATLPQPVPLGNPPSNSETKSTSTASPASAGPQSESGPAAPTKP